MDKISINLKQIQKERYFHGSVWNKKILIHKVWPNTNIPTLYNLPICSILT